MEASDVMHECEWTSVCCGAPPCSYVDTLCGGCHEHTAFECLVGGHDDSIHGRYDG